MPEGTSVPALKGASFGRFSPDSAVVKNVAGNERLPIPVRRKIVGHLTGYRKVRGPKKSKEAKAAAKEQRKALKKSIYGPLGLVSERQKLSPEAKKARRSAKGKLTRQLRAEWARNNPDEARKLGFNPDRLGKTPKAKKTTARKIGAKKIGSTGRGKGKKK